MPEIQKTKSHEITYTPLGESQKISLTISMVKNMLCHPTRSGQLPTDQDVIKFMMLCRARELNPWTDDAYLLGYDTKDGPQFSLITSYQALLKRAENSQQFDGLDGGVIVQRDDMIEQRRGELVHDGETLIGGWATAYRKDREHPAYKSVKLSVYNTGRSRWSIDPGGMIVKVAKAGALRESFASQLSQMYTDDEFRVDNIMSIQPEAKQIKSDPRKKRKQNTESRDANTAKDAKDEPEDGKSLLDEAMAELQEADNMETISAVYRRFKEHLTEEDLTRFSEACSAAEMDL